MDIGINLIVEEVISSTGGYLVVYLPLFLFVMGLVLALAIIGRLITFFYPDKDDTITDNRGG
jgi:hypothetical protein